jgi:hypothetical protein
VTTRVSCSCQRCRVKRDPELVRYENGGRHLETESGPAYLSDHDSGTLVYRMRTAQPCQCGCREVVFRLVLDGFELR